jgi:hypothetical protein
MDKEEANQILKDNKMTKVRFAQLIGLKVGTVRTAFGANKLSKRMVRRLEKLDIRSEEKKPSIIEGMVRQTMDIPLESVARIYGVPKNRFLRLIEFKDGTHGKFRCKPGKYLKLGEEVRVTPLKGDMWEVVR